MHHELSSIAPGWTVYDANQDKVGEVAEAGTNFILVQKGLLFIKDLYIPTQAITQVDDANQCLYLNVAKGDVDRMGWDTPPAETADYGTAYADTDATTSRAYTETSYTEGVATGTGADYGTEDRQRLALHEEELQAQTRRAQAGEVQVSKRVVEERQDLEVPVTHEEVEIRRVRVNREDSGTSEPFTADGDTIRVPVTAEQVEVTKRPKVVEEIEISKRAVTERQRVSETVRREEADIQQQGDVVVGEGSRSADLVGAGADRFERATIDEDEEPFQPNRT